MRSRRWLIKRRIRFWWQRKTRGWDDSETWTLFVNIAEFIIPRLKRFNELKCGYPPELTYEQWDEIIDKMIMAFEWIKRDEMEVAPKVVDEGLDLFRKYFFHLWD